jgi:hypothetical protein|tara:strand:+ start:1675 stop:1881 length:207 start_codon:yes stop_codon:yes gene_type:complete
MSKQTITSLVNRLKKYATFSDTWKETERNLIAREKQTAKDWANYCTDVRQELMDRPMSFDDWYEAYNK